MNVMLVQFLSAFIISLSLYQFSLSMVWPSYISPLLRNSTILDEPFTDSHMALIGSLPMLGCVFSTVAGGLVWDRLGRKYTMILGTLFFVVAWTIISVTKSITLIMAARLLDGIGGGLNLAMANMMVGEFSLPNIRGVLTTILSMMFNAGTVASYIIGALCSYQMISLVNLCFSVLIVGLVFILKESPVVLVQKGKEKEALKSLRFYRGSAASDQELQEELDSLKNLVGADYHLVPGTENGKIAEKPDLTKAEEANLTKAPGSKNPFVLIFTNSSSRRGLFLIVFEAVSMVFLGTMAITAYAGPFFIKAVPSMSPHLCSILLGFTNVIGSLVSMVITDRLGRRFLMIGSSGLACVCLTALASQLAWCWGPDWVVPAIMLISCFCLMLGAVPVPGILIGEYFTPEVKTIGTSICLASMWLSNFALLAIFASMVNTFGLGGTFLCFAIVASIMCLGSFLFLPETSGLKMEAIQDLLASRVFHFRSKTA